MQGKFIKLFDKNFGIKCKNCNKFSEKKLLKENNSN